MKHSRRPAPVLLAGLVVMRADGSKDVVEIGPAGNMVIDARQRWWRRRHRLVVTFPDHAGPVTVTHTPSGILPATPTSMPDLPVDTTDTRYQDARRLNAA